MKERKTVLIFGVSSFVGSSLAEFLKKDFKVIGTYYQTKVSIPHVLTLPCDVLNRDQVQMITFACRPDFTIYAVGLTSLEYCYRFPKLADALNTAGVFNVTENSERYGSRIIMLSTAYVFNGEKRNFLESDTPDPNTMYGKTKTAAEFFIQKSCLNYIIIRIGRLYGRSINYRQKTFFESLETKMSNDENMTIDNYVSEGFVDVEYLAIIIKLCIERDTNNRLFQLSSKNVMTFYDFAKLYCKVFRASDALVGKGRWPFYQIEGYPSSRNGLQYQLDIFNLESFFGIEMPCIEESVEFTYEKWGGKKSQKTRTQKGSGIQFI